MSLEIKLLMMEVRQMVKLRPNETFESLLKRFKKYVVKNNIIQDYRKHEYFMKPSVRRKLKSEIARKRARKFGR
jgi:small subunit ribosomal protein S21